MTTEKIVKAKLEQLDEIYQRDNHWDSCTVCF
jgi:hypothetical protein